MTHLEEYKSLRWVRFIEVLANAITNSSYTDFEMLRTEDEESSDDKGSVPMMYGIAPPIDTAYLPLVWI